MPDDLEKYVFNLSSDQPDIQEIARAHLESLGKSAVPALLQALHEDKIGGVGKAQVLFLLGRLALSETLPQILAALNDPRFNVKFSAMTALNFFSDQAVTEALVELLQDSDIDIVQHAAGLLASRKDPIAVKPLISLLENNAAGIRYSAARALGEIDGKEAKEALAKQMTKETDPEIFSLIKEYLRIR